MSRKIRDDNYQYRKIYYNNKNTFIIVFFIIFSLLMGVLICYSKISYDESIFIPIITLSPIIFIQFILLYLNRLHRIENHENEIVIYGQSYNKVSFLKSLKNGHIIKFDNILSIDLMPIKYFNFVLTYQICVRTIEPFETFYINSFSNLDRLFIEIRARRFKNRKRTISNPDTDITVYIDNINDFYKKEVQKVNIKKKNISDLFLRRVFRREYRINLANYKLKTNSYNKPYIDNLIYQFNLSHSGSLIALGVTSEEVGIDIERIDKKRRVTKLAQRILTENEYEKYISLNDEEKVYYFYEMWTKKESYVKMKGEGIKGFFNNLDPNYEKYIWSMIIKDKEEKEYYLSVCALSIENNLKDTKEIIKIKDYSVNVD